MVFTIASICLVASPERSASRCTSSATTVNPRPGLAGRRRLDRRVQREHVRLLGDVGDQLDDLADLERGFAEALDPLRRVLDLRADLVHARDLVLHRLPALLRGGQRLLRHAAPTARRVCDTSLIDCAICSTDADACWISRFCRCDASNSRFEIACASCVALRHLVGRRVDALDQRAQLLDREVDRVGDRAGHVLGHRRLHGEVAVGEVAHLVQQPQDRLLVALVLAARSRRRARARRRGTPCRAARRQPSAEQRERRSPPTACTRATGRRSRTRRRACVVSVSSGSDSLLIAARRLLGGDEAVHVLQDRGDARRRRRRSASASSASVARASSLRTAREAQRVAALEEPVQDVAERAGVLAEQERDLGIDLVGRRERVGVLRDPLRQHRELVRVLDLAQRCRRPAPICCAACCASSRSALLPWLMRVEALGERRQALLVVEQRARRWRRRAPSAP